jgi:predicted nucleic acid-binding protein
MRVAYVDTSALVAVLLGEPQASEVRSSLAAADRLFAANLVEAELRSVLHRERLTDGVLQPALAAIHWLFPVRSLRSEFERILGLGHLRGADLWHLACVLYLGETVTPAVLISCDQRQREIAGKLGVETSP